MRTETRELSEAIQKAGVPRNEFSVKAKPGIFGISQASLKWDWAKKIELVESLEAEGLFVETAKSICPEYEGVDRILWIRNSDVKQRLK